MKTPLSQKASRRAQLADTMIVLALVSLGALTPGGAHSGACDAVNPFIGTTGLGRQDFAYGNTFPGATAPFGMIQWGPDTRENGWYYHEDRTIRGFSLTHLSGTGCPVFADVPILPWIGALDGPGLPSDYVLPFSHDHEQAHPGYYSVEFDNGIKAELTVAARAGIGRFMFPANAQRTLLIKAGSSASVDNPKRKADASTVVVSAPDTVTGTVHSGGFCDSDNNYTLYFVLKFDRPFSSVGTWTTGVTPGSTAASGHKAGAYVSFPPGSGPIVAKVGLSYVSVENASANLQAEIPGWDFEGVHAAAGKLWAEALDRVQADGGTPDQRVVFYTGLYHMMQSPNIFNDENGDYVGFDGLIRRLPRGQSQYANYSDWDIYRNVIQLQAMLFPRQTGQMAQSLVRDAEQSGWLPRWPVANDVSYIMGGDSPSIVVSDAYAFGGRSFDTATALRYMVKGATQVGTGPHGQPERQGLADYLARGFIPVDASDEDGASITLELASSDFAISRFAAAMGDPSDAAKLLHSSQNWRALFDKDSGFIRPRTPDGSFIGGWDPDNLMPRHKDWDPADQLGFQEGSTWQYTWMIPHNYAGLVQAMGGNAQVVPKLDKFFRSLFGWGVSTYTVTNEPDFCAAYAYLWTDSPWKTQKVIDRIRRETFSAKPDGIPGNDDLGATSGVYVWGALGMYPVIPGVGGLVLGTPMFPRVVMRLGNGRDLEILAHGDGIYVQSVKLNGRSYDRSWLPLSLLSEKKNRLEFLLGPQPNLAWGAKSANQPPSFDDAPAAAQSSMP